MKGSGDLVFVAGQIGWDRHGHMVAGDFAAQFAQALDNVLEVVWKAGGGPALGGAPGHLRDRQGRVPPRSQKEIGAAYRARMGKHFPAMVLVEVKSLLEDDAKVEIEATAVV